MLWPRVGGKTQIRFAVPVFPLKATGIEAELAITAEQADWFFTGGGGLCSQPQ